MNHTLEQLQFLIGAINGFPIQGTPDARTKGQLLVMYSDELEKAAAKKSPPKKAPRKKAAAKRK